MRFLAIEHQLPSRVVTNDEVLTKLREQSAKHLSQDDLELLLELTANCFKSAKTTVRYHRAEGETAFDITRSTGLRALERANLLADDIDLLIYVGIGRGIIEPASANIFQDALKLRNATCFDLLDACASWARALQMAEAYLKLGYYKNIMIISAEFVGADCHRYELKSLAEFAHWNPSVTIGEACAVTIVSGADDDAGFQCSFKNWGEKRDLCFVPLPNCATYFGKDIDPSLSVENLPFISYGVKLMDFGAEKMISHYKAMSGFNASEPDIVFGHSASDGISQYVMDRCGIDRKKYYFMHSICANTISASVPLAMSHAMRNNRLSENDKVLVLVASAGVATALLKFRFRYGPT